MMWFSGRRPARPAAPAPFYRRRLAPQFFGNRFMSDLVKVDVIDRIQVITINRPEARNAINYETAQELARALERMDASDDIVMGVLTGAGNTFSSGMDLKIGRAHV